MEMMKQISLMLERKIAQLRSKVETLEKLLTSTQHCGATADAKGAPASAAPEGEANSVSVSGDGVEPEVIALPASGCDNMSGELLPDDSDFDSASEPSIFEDPALDATAQRSLSSHSGMLSECRDAVLPVSPPNGWVPSRPHVGDTVLISGLVQAKQYNSKSGSIVQEVDDAGRVAVRFGPCRSPVRIKVQNVFYPAFCPFCSAEVTSGHCMACQAGSQMILHDICTSKSTVSGDPCTLNTHSMTHIDINSAASSTPASALAAVKGTSSQMQVAYSSHGS